MDEVSSKLSGTHVTAYNAGDQTLEKSWVFWGKEPSGQCCPARCGWLSTRHVRVFQGLTLAQGSASNPDTGQC